MAAETSRLTRGYARAILAVADAEDCVDQVENQLRDVLDFYQQSAELRQFFANPGVEGIGKRQALERLLAKQKITPVVISHLGLLIEQGHGRLLPEVVDDFVHEAALVRGSMTAEVTSAVEMTDAQLTRLREALTKRTGHGVVLRPVVDPSIGGGIVVRVGDEVFDGSLAQSLTRLRESLTTQ